MERAIRKRRVSLAFALGSGCGTSRILRERGLQFASFPLDWVGGLGVPGTGQGLRNAADIVARKFAGWFLRENLERVLAEDSPKYDGYRDNGTGLFFSHDFSRGGDLDAEYPAASEKYRRRIERFNGLLGKAREALAVWIADPRDSGEVSEDDARYALGVLRKTYPSVRFRLVCASCRRGVSFAEDRVVSGDGYELHAFDYRLMAEGLPEWEIRGDLLASFIDGYACDDYRSFSEKRANARRERIRAYEKFKASSPWTFWINRLEFKLYRHLKRRLERKGILKGLERTAAS